jgi:hypothetical protein
VVIRSSLWSSSESIIIMKGKEAGTEEEEEEEELEELEELEEG